MRVYTVFSIFFFLISSLFLSTEGLSLAKKEKAGAVSTKAKGAEADTGEQTETADSNDKAEGKDSEDSETLDLKVETVEKVETKEGQPAEAETKEGLGGADGKSKEGSQKNRIYLFISFYHKQQMFNVKSHYFFSH